MDEGMIVEGSAEEMESANAGEGEEVAKEQTTEQPQQTTAQAVQQSFFQ